MLNWPPAGSGVAGGVSKNSPNAAGDAAPGCAHSKKFPNRPYRHHRRTRSRIARPVRHAHESRTSASSSALNATQRA